METIKINLVQNCIENAMGNMVAKYAIVKDADGMAYVIAEEDKDEWQGFEIAAIAEVTRPYVMLGDSQEIESDIIREVKAAVLEAGVCVENECGTMFVK